MAVPVVAASAAPAAMSGLGTLLGGAGAALGSLTALLPSTTSKSGSSKTQRVFDQAAIDKLIYDVLAADQGLASLASGENLSGGFNSSAKTLQTQDFLTKLIGELAVASSPQVTESKETSSKKMTVICTELALQGYLDPDLYEAGGPASRQVCQTTWIGYHSWATGVVEVMKRSPRLCRFLAPIVTSRYRYLTGAPGANVLGRITVWVGHPVCYLIGTAINWSGGYGRANEFA